MKRFKPNILFAFADDWGRFASVYAGLENGYACNRRISTPHIDRIAREGALFSNAYVPAPSCTPCRSSLLSGRYFWQTGLGAILSGAVWDSSIPTFPKLLEESGYHIGYTYKVWSPGSPADAPFGGIDKAFQQAGTRFNEFSIEASKLAESMGTEQAKNVLYGEVRGNFDAFWNARQADGTGKPFCYWWGPTNTHRKWQKGSGKRLWDIEPDDLKGKLPAYLPDVAEIREDVADYMGEAMAFDAGLGVLLERLEALGELDDTLVVVSGDHGIPGVSRGKCNLYDWGCETGLAVRWPERIKPGRVIDDMVNIMDLAPTFLEAGGVGIPDGMCAKSLMPLLVSGKGGQLDPCRDHVVTGRERHVASAREDFLPYPQRAVRTRDFLFIMNFAPDRWPMGDPCGMDDQDASPPPAARIENDTFVLLSDCDASPTKAWMVHNRKKWRGEYEMAFGKRPKEELYAVNEDPDHLRNLADDPQYAKDKEALRARLFQTLEKERDPRICDRYCRYDDLPFTSRIEPT